LASYQLGRIQIYPNSNKNFIFACFFLHFLFRFWYYCVFSLVHNSLAYEILIQGGRLSCCMTHAPFHSWENLPISAAWLASRAAGFVIRKKCIASLVTDHIYVPLYLMCLIPSLVFTTTQPSHHRTRRGRPPEGHAAGRHADEPKEPGARGAGSISNSRRPPGPGKIDGNGRRLGTRGRVLPGDCLSLTRAPTAPPSFPTHQRTTAAALHRRSRAPTRAPRLLGSFLVLYKLRAPMGRTRTSSRFDKHHELVPTCFWRFRWLLSLPLPSTYE
jgi:hypothetical protein